MKSLKRLTAFALTLAMVCLPIVALAEEEGPRQGALGASEPQYAVSAVKADNAVTPDTASLPEAELEPAWSDERVKPLYPFVGTQYNTSPGYNKRYVVGVDTANQVITIVKRGESGDYDVPVKYFICSTGTAKDPTPDGIYVLPDDARYDWMYFKKFTCYVRYPVRIFDDYFFHSLIYNKQDISSLSASSLKNLGKKASHGCIRMLDNEAQWMSENIEPGTITVVYAGISDPALNKALKPAL